MSQQQGRDSGRRGTRRTQGEVHIDLGFGELFKGLGNFLDLVGHMAEEGKSETSATKEVVSPSGLRGVYGFSVKMGLGGKPTVEHFGNVRTTPAGPKVSEVREPIVDVFDEGDHILVVAELPGVTEADIQVEVKDDILNLTAEGRRRKYAKEVLLPAMVKTESLRRSYQGGILELNLDKA